MMDYLVKDSIFSIGDRGYYSHDINSFVFKTLSFCFYMRDQSEENDNIQKIIHNKLLSTYGTVHKKNALQYM